MSRALTLHTVTIPRDLRDFIAMPAEVYRDDPNWIRPLNTERKTHLGPANPYFKHAEVRFRLVRDANGRAVGRISMQHDTMAPRVGDKPEGHFGLLEAVDAEVMGLLLDDAEAWLRARGAPRVVGPYSLSVNDESGLLVEGHGLPPRVMMNYAPPWYAAAIEARGYTKAKDLLALLLDMDQPTPPGAQRMAAQAHSIPGFSDRNFDVRVFDQELLKVRRIFNDAWSANWGFVPLTEAEVLYSGVNLKPVFESELGRFIQIDGEPVGMIVALADINEAIRGLDGRLWPFGWARLLWRLKVKKPTTARIILMGLSRTWQKDLRSAALVSALIMPLVETLRRKGFKKLELSWILEDNRPTIRLAELFGATVERRYRMFQKDLA